MTIEGAIEELIRMKSLVPDWLIPAIDKIIETVEEERNDNIIMRKACELMAIEMSKTSSNSSESLWWHYVDKAEEFFVREAERRKRDKEGDEN